MNPDTVPPTIARENETRLQELAQLLKGRGFRLGIVRCNQQLLRQALARRIREIVSDGVDVVDVQLSGPVQSLREAIKRSLPPGNGRRALFVFGFEQSIPSEGESAALAALNNARELYAREFSFPFVLWLPDYAVTRLAREAPDFWSWRSGVYEFCAEPDILDRVYVEAVASHRPNDSMTLAEKEERIAVLEGLLKDYQELPPGNREKAARADILRQLGELYGEMYFFGKARDSFERSIELFRDVGDQAAIAITLIDMGALAQQGNPEAAKDYYRKSLELLEKIGKEEGIALTLGNMADLALQQGDYEAARNYYTESLGRFQKFGDEGGVARILLSMGDLAREQGDREAARNHYAKSLELSQKIGHEWLIGHSLSRMGGLAKAAGDNEVAKGYYGRSLELFRKVADNRWVADTLRSMGDLARRQGDTALASDYYVKSLELFQQIGDKLGVALTLSEMGDLAGTQGDMNVAENYYQQSLEIFQNIEAPQWIALTLLRIGDLATQRGDSDAAADAYRQSLEIFQKIGHKLGISLVQSSLKAMNSK